MYIIGIDPGKNGGIVAISGMKLPKVVDITSMPGSISALWDHFIYLGFPNLINKEETYVFTEAVHSMPTDGSKAAFSFGRHIGWLDCVLDRLCRHATIKMVPPIIWQSYFGLARRATKKDDIKESKYDYKKRILEYGRFHLYKGNRIRKGQSEKGLTLKTCDAYLIALYGYNYVKENSTKTNEAN